MPDFITSVAFGALITLDVLALTLAATNARKVGRAVAECSRAADNADEAVATVLEVVEQNENVNHEQTGDGSINRNPEGDD